MVRDMGIDSVQDVAQVAGQGGQGLAVQRRRSGRLGARRQGQREGRRGRRAGRPAQGHTSRTPFRSAGVGAAPRAVGSASARAGGCRCSRASTSVLRLETVYNQWTQFEDWPQFMHRVTRVTQEDDCTVSFATKIWGKTKEFTAKIETQRPDERIKWRVSQGITHAGVVTFHELGPNLTRVLLDARCAAGRDAREGGPRHASRQARRARGPASLQGIRRDAGAGERRVARRDRGWRTNRGARSQPTTRTASTPTRKRFEEESERATSRTKIGGRRRRRGRR